MSTPDTEAMPVEGSVAASDEPAFSAAREALRAQRAPSRSPLVLGLILLIGFFVLERRDGGKVFEIVMLMFVLLVHELGHAIAMRMFGFQDVKMFFLPGFGAITSGRKQAAPAWQHALIALMGPAPGLVIAFVLFVSGAAKGPESVVRDLAVMFTFINALNLLPIAPLDGGHFLTRTLFSRSPTADAVFTGATSIVLGVLAWQAKLYLLLVVAVLVLLGTPRRVADAKAAQRIRDATPVVPPKIEEAPDPYLRALYDAVTDVREGPQAAFLRASRMRTLHDVVASPAVTVSTAVLLVLCYGMTLTVGALTIFVAVYTAVPR